MFRDSDRRSDIDKAYQKLIQVIFENIDRIADYLDPKPPGEVVLFGELRHTRNSFKLSLKILIVLQITWILNHLGK